MYTVYGIRGGAPLPLCLKPWCTALKGRIYDGVLGCEEPAWHAQRRHLSVGVPSRTDKIPEGKKNAGSLQYPTEAKFQENFQKAREALLLLGALYHVDQWAVKYLLGNYCDVEMGEEGEEMSEEDNDPRFVLVVDMENTENGGNLDLDLAQFCSVNARGHPSVKFVKALAKIAAMDKKMQPDKPGVDIEVPVRVCFAHRERTFSKSPAEALEDIARTERVVKEDWVSYVQTPGNELAAPKSMRCRFVLEPMVADLELLPSTPQFGQTLENLVRNNFWFSRLVVDVGEEEEGEEESTLETTNQCVRRATTGQIFRSVFDSKRRLPEEAATKHVFDPKISTPARWHQIEALHLGYRSDQKVSDLAALCSAAVVNQTTRKLTMNLCVEETDEAIRAQMWMWMAYGFFSKRARAFSSLESLTFTTFSNFCQISEAGIEAFKSILQSDHPEEDLYDSPRGKVAERDGTLKPESPIRWHFDENGLPVISSEVLQVSTPIEFVRTFSDDGVSQWVNAIVPGFGRCQVGRCDLAFDETTRLDEPSSTLTSLHLFLSEAIPAAIEGLPHLLAAIGPTLKELALLDVEFNADENLFLSYCPNLVEMRIQSGFMEARLNFSDYHASNTPLPSLRLNREDMVALVGELSDAENPLAKCMQRLRVRVNYVHRSRGQVVADSLMESLLQMLKVNKRLEYLDVVAPLMYSDHVDSFDKHHNEILYRLGKPLPLECKAAFLSLRSLQQHLPEPNLKRTSAMVSTKRAVADLDEHVIRKIFFLAGSPVSRLTYLRLAEDDDFDGEGNEIHL